MENREYLNSLFDIYGELLTDIEKETFINYYGEDLSLSEIADNRSISKSSVSKTLNSAQNKLLQYEKTIKFLEKKEKILKLLTENDITIIKEKINYYFN